MPTTKLNLMAAILIGSGIISACSAKNETSTEIKKDLITVDINADIATLDPQKSEDAPSHRVINDLFEGLTSYDQKVYIIPGLASKWVGFH